MPDTPLNPDALANLRLLADRATEEVRHAVIEPDILHKLLDHLAVAQPVVSSVEELDALPVGSVFMDSDKDWAYQIISNGEPGHEGRVIVGAGLEEDFGADELTFPLTVLGRPEVK